MLYLLTGGRGDERAVDAASDGIELVQAGEFVALPGESLLPASLGGDITDGQGVSDHLVGPALDRRRAHLVDVLAALELREGVIRVETQRGPVDERADGLAEDRRPVGFDEVGGRRIAVDDPLAGVDDDDAVFQVADGGTMAQLPGRGDQIE